MWEPAESDRPDAYHRGVTSPPVPSARAHRPATVEWAAPLAAMLVVASAGAGFALGWAQPVPVSTVGSGGFERWVDATVDHRIEQVGAAVATELLDRQGRSLVNGSNDAIAGVPFSSFSVRLAGASAPDADEVRAGEFRARAIVEYRLPVDGVRVGRTADAEFELGPHGWRLTALTGSGRDLWDHEPVESVRNGRVLVLGPRADARLDELGSLAEQARADVAEFWSARWPRSAVVVMPSESRLLDPLVGTAAGSDQVAVTVWQTGSDGPVVRVLVNPTVYDRMPTLARQIVLRHEITHVAQDALPRTSVPTWLTEGLAEYVGYLDSGIPTSFVGAELFAQVRASGAPDALPSEAEFGLGRPTSERRIAYQAGWAFCQMVAQNYGQDRLVPFYVAVSRGDGTADERLDAAAEKVLDVDFDVLRAQWQAWLRANA